MASPSRNLIIIGSSTGGPEALQKLFSALPALDAVVVLVQHMPAFINESLAASLNRVSAMNCRIIKETKILETGAVHIAPSGRHLLLGADGGALFSDLEPVNFVRPSIDVAMESVAPAAYRKIAGVILTGMGADGAKGLMHLKALRALTLAQDKESSTVYGMPKAAVELGGVMEVLTLDLIAPRLTAFVGPAR